MNLHLPNAFAMASRANHYGVDGRKLLISFPVQTRARTSSTMVRSNGEHRSHQMLRDLWISGLCGLQEPTFRIYLVAPTVSLFQLWESPQPATLVNFSKTPHKKHFHNCPMPLPTWISTQCALFKQPEPGQGSAVQTDHTVPVSNLKPQRTAHHASTNLRTWDPLTVQHTMHIVDPSPRGISRQSLHNP